MAGLLGLLAVGLVIAILAMTGYTLWTLTHPPRRTYASALAKGRPGDPGELAPGPRGPRAWTAWHLKWRDLSLPVWDITGDVPSGPVFVLSHGWGDSRVGGLSRTAHILPIASRVVLWDMPGHGEAPGTCSLGVHEPDALLALVDRLAEERPLVLLGWSMGAGVSIVAAAQASPAHHRIAAVVAESPQRHSATPARNMLIARGLPWRLNLPPAMWLLGLLTSAGGWWRGFDRLEFAKRLRGRLLVLHGTEDEISPISDGLALAAAAPDGRIVEFEGAGHYGLWTEPETAQQCAAAVREFALLLTHDFQPIR